MPVTSEEVDAFLEERDSVVEPYVCMCICVFTYIYIYTYVCVYTYVYMNIHAPMILIDTHCQVFSIRLSKRMLCSGPFGLLVCVTLGMCLLSRCRFVVLATHGHFY